MIRESIPRRNGSAALVILAWSGVIAAAPPTVAQGRACAPVSHEGDGYIVCQIDLRVHRLELFWRDRKGEPFGSLGALNRQLQAEGQRPLFTMNAGMYHAALDPVGLYVENGRQIVKASTTNGPGNFHMKPNGVFFVANGKADILETGQFLKRNIRPEIATQSGPMLVINGKLHPKFPSEGVSRKVRNGVGVKDADTVYFAISEGAVTFTDFAKLFLDRLGTPNALFLDGSVSSISAPGIERAGFRALGPMIGAFERGRKSDPQLSTR
ncbi:MAG: phosphodiester glycosidase family protein [Methylocystis sp.]|nr:phosphodiester glycosidase family protein [Methylocystis sp.]MCA3584459.1 phosphodiester glycosidase family protein [Methylocystis sp.]MCA3588000.1 phosphodiester glycosidase family protein [Methylocystis sp.]MCA3590519.1 phosphodiester glycosidase family protein [Methylocystis sp.]